MVLFKYRNRDRANNAKPAKNAYSLIVKLGVATIVALAAAFIAFGSSNFQYGLIFLLAAIGCGYFAYLSWAKKRPPVPKVPEPDMYGLHLYKGDNYRVTFAAMGEKGKQDLIKIKTEIRNNEGHLVTITNITVEENHGIINTGDDNEYSIEDWS